MQIDLDIETRELERLPRDVERLIADLTFGIKREIELTLQRGNVTAAGRAYPVRGADGKRKAIKRGRGSKRRVVGYEFRRASAPGQPPAIDQGNLRNSLHAEMEGLQGEIVIGAEYAGLLEYGTARMAARPFVEPAIDLVLQRQLPQL